MSEGTDQDGFVYYSPYYSMFIMKQSSNNYLQNVQIEMVNSKAETIAQFFSSVSGIELGSTNINYQFSKLSLYKHQSYQ